MLKRHLASALLLAQGALSEGALLTRSEQCPSVSTTTVFVLRDVTVTISPAVSVTTVTDQVIHCRSTVGETESSVLTSDSTESTVVASDTMDTMSTMSTVITSSSAATTSTSSSSGTVSFSVPNTTVAKYSTTTTSTTSAQTAKPSSAPPTNGLYNMLYFGAWSIYNLQYNPQNLPSGKVSHVLYAFPDIAPDGTVFSADPYADYQIRFPGDSQEPDDINAYGNVKQLYLHKLKNRNLKTLLSIGGWTYSQEGKFINAANTPEARQRFASSAVKMMSDWAFDGLDIDWEYPATAQEAEWFVLLLKACREALDTYAADNGQEYHYLLTIAVSSGPKNYKILDMAAVDQFVDTWNLMAYDYSGSWDTTTGHAANIYNSQTNPECTKFSTHQAVQDHIKGGVSPNKIILGMPLYGRSFMNTENSLGKAFDGVATGTSTDDGVWLYRDLPHAGAEVNIDHEAVGAWSYNAATKELVSFDNADTTKMKADYIHNQNLGGVMFWEAAGDKDGEDSLVGTMTTEMGGIAGGQNMVDYPNSRFVNIKNQMK